MSEEKKVADLKSLLLSETILRVSSLEKLLIEKNIISADDLNKINNDSVKRLLEMLNQPNK